jgi:hypothetical protein
VDVVTKVVSVVMVSVEQITVEYSRVVVYVVFAVVNHDTRLLPDDTERLVMVVSVGMLVVRTVVAVTVLVQTEVNVEV